MSAISKIRSALRLDGWANTLTGLGLSTRDKVTASTFYTCQQLADESLESLYYGDDLAHRIVSALVDEAMRQGFEVEEAGEGESEEGGEDETEAKLYDECERLGVAEKLTEAAIWGRLFGGSALWVGANDGQDSDAPLVEERISAVDFIHVLDKREMTPITYYSDPAAAQFGQVETYRVDLGARALGVATVTATVHASRLVIFPGAPTSARQRAKLAGWDHSVLHAVYEVLRATQSNWQSVQHLMSDASQAVYKVKGLIELIAAGQEDTMRARMELVEQGRSVSRAIILDAEGEDFTRQATPLSGIPDILDRSMQRLSAAACMPMTVLWGMSPAGMNATGESDTRMWYDQVKAYQEKVLRPRLLRVVRLMAQSIGADPLVWEVCFPSLWQQSEKEKAEVRKLVAETDAIYIDKEVLLPEEVALSRFGVSGYSSETQVDLDARQLILEAETAKAVEKAGEPDPVPPPPFGAPPGPPSVEPAPVAEEPAAEAEEEGSDDEAA